MKQFEVLVEKELICVVRKSALAKKLSIKINSRGELRATVPWWVTRRRVVSFIKKNKTWILNRVAKVRNAKAESLLQLGERDDYLLNKKSARELVLRRLEHFNQFYGFSYERVAIRDQRTRWGSCSSKRNLNFNYRIVQLPQKHADYLIVHELCHLKHLNHSGDFWSLVAQTIPDYRRLSKELRRM